MANFSRLGLIFEDLKTSWYFRVWALAWLACALSAFSCLIILGKISRTEGIEKSSRQWFERQDPMHFPDFGLFSAGPNIYGNISCNFEGQEVPKTSCPSTFWPVTRGWPCYAFQGSKFAAKDNTASDFKTNKILCDVWTELPPTANYSRTDLLVGWDLTDTHSVGPNSYASMWFRATELGWVLVNKLVVDQISSTPLWERNQMYHTTESNPGHYHIDTVVNSFWVAHVDYQDWYNGWMALGEIGGFCFAVFILHTIFMAIVGIFLENNSKYLSASSYSEIQTIH